MFVISVDFRIKPEHVERFRAAMHRQAENSLTREEGCLQFDVCSEPGAPGHVFLYEVYRDEAAFDLHVKTEHFAEFDALTQPWIESKTILRWHQEWPAAT